jgi:hypothetical protein
MYKALLELFKQNKDSYTIVETGVAAHGTRSTLLWDKFVNIFGGKVLSVDLNKDAVITANNLTSDKTTVYHSDSLDYLPTITEKIDFLYLDSVDGWDSNSHIHQLKEIEIALPKLHKNSLILLDDIGYKTNLSIPFLKQNGWCQIMIDNCPDSHNMIQALFLHEENLFDPSFIKR